MSQTITEHLNNRDKQQSTPFKIVGGTGYYIVNGEPIPKAEFESLYPIDKPIKSSDKNKWKGINPDSTSLA